jgi:trimeric autotransporter adhesin
MIKGLLLIPFALLLAAFAPSKPNENDVTAPLLTANASLIENELPDIFHPKPKEFDRQDQTSLEEALNEDGTLKKGFEGSFDPSGYSMSYRATGEPVFISVPLGAGDERWQPMPQFTGLNGTVVYSILAVGDDVYVGGDFTDVAGNPSADYIAVWNGGQWKALGEGLNAIVYTIAMSGSTIYAGGDFTDAGGHAGGDRIAKWDGSTWSTLGNGLNDRVRTIVADGVDVYVGGRFNDSGAENGLNYIALWNNGWHSLASGVFGYVRAIFVSNSNVYVGFGNYSASMVQKWNGTEWSAIGSYFQGANVGNIRAIAVVGTKVYIGGTFLNAQDIPAADYLAVYDEANFTWSAVGGGVNSVVYSLTVKGNILYVGGEFENAGGIMGANNIATWNGSSWNSSATGLNSAVLSISFSDDSQLYIAGWFTNAGGNQIASRVAIWNGTNIQAMGTGLSKVKDIGVIGSTVYALGYGGNATGLLRWNGSVWENFGGNLNGSIYSMKVIGTNVYVAGSFTDAGGIADADYIAKWDGNNWNAVGPVLNNGANVVYRIFVNGTDIYAYSEFNNGGTIVKKGWYFFNGVSWSSFIAPEMAVSSMDFSGSTIYVAGSFKNFNGIEEADGIVKWNGNTWEAMASGLNDYVNVVKIVDGVVFAGGGFLNAGGNETADYLAVWDASANSWKPLGSGLSAGSTTVGNGASSVNRIAASGKNIYFGLDYITNVGGNPNADNIVVWNGTSWEALGSGLNGAVWSLEISQNTVYVGGFFTASGDESVTAYHIIKRDGVFPQASLLSDATNITPTTATLSGFGSRGGLPATYQFQWGAASGNYPNASAITNLTGDGSTPVTSNITALIPNTVYYYRLKVENAEGISYSEEKSFSNVIPLSFAAAIAPVQNGTNYVVSATLQNGRGTKQVKLFYRSILQQDFIEVPVTLSLDKYEASIPKDELDELGIEYYFTAVDVSVAIPIESRSLIYTPVPANTKVPNLSFGGDIKNYRMFSMPYQLDNNSVQNLFGLLGGVDKTKWRLIRYTNGDNQNYPQFSTIDLGKAYWFNAREAVDINVGSGTASQFNQSNSFTLSLEQGWNQIGNPYPFNISWAALQAANPGKVGNLKVFAPESVSFVESPTLTVWSGGFVFAEQATDMVFPLLALSSTSPSAREANMHTSTAANNFTTEEWYLPLALQQGSVTNTLLGVGMHPQASLSKDERDEVTLPRFVQYLEMSTRHEDYFAPLFSRDIVPSAKQHTWEFTLNTNVSNEPITLNWDPTLFGSDDSELLLYDPTEQRFIDMRSTGSYTFSASTDRKLSVYYSTADEPLSTTFSTLLNPAPNPAEEGTTLSVVLKERSTMRLTILDMHGKNVKTIKQGEEERGIHSYIWNRNGDAGTRLPQGIYLVQLKVGGMQHIKRLVIK